MNGLNRAQAIKAEIKNNISVLMPQDKKTSTRRNVEEDPENVVIKTLRQEQKLTWSEIASYLNQERLNKGEAATFTDAAVYSRFVRNAPRIANPVSEVGFDPKDYMHLRHPNQYTQAQGTGAISKAGKKRVKNYDNATELKANVRQTVSTEVHDNDLETAEMTEQLMDAVAKCERNFWKYVADELERATTKMYNAEKLASRYHAI
jgi:exopolysaccharide biosynthesis protein